MLNNGKEWAGVFIACIVVAAYIGIGFVTVVATVLFGVDGKFPPDWSSAMLSLASAALGFLIGKQGTGTGIITQSPVVENVENVNVASTPKPVTMPLPAGMKSPTGAA